MYDIFKFLHVLGAVFMGFYLMLPFLSARISALSGQAQFGFVNVLFAANRAGQLALVIELLTGGYLVGKAQFPIIWMILALVLFLALGAFTGIVGKQMRTALADASGKAISNKIGKIRLFSNLIGITYLLIIVIMSFPRLFA